MHRKSFIIGPFLPPLFFLIVAAIVFWQTNTDLVEKNISSGSMQYNAAFVPELLSTLLVVLAVIQIIQISRGATVTPEVEFSTDQPPERKLILRSIAAVLLLGLYIIILRPLGFHIATPLFLASILALLDVRNLLFLIGLSVSLSFASAYVFGRLLNVVLPAGIFEIAPF